MKLEDKHIDLPSYALGDNELLTIMKGKVKIIEYPEIVKYKTIDDLLSPYNNVIILVETEKSRGHWIALFKDNRNIIHFFDSYGFDMDDELKFIPGQFKQRNGYWFPLLTYLVAMSGLPYTHNKYKLQSWRKGINTCGRWCCWRLLNTNMSDDAFGKQMKNYKDPDLVVTKITNRIMGLI